MNLCRIAIVAAFLSTLSPQAAWSAEPGEIATYNAEYQVEYKGRRVARAQFDVTRDSAGQFVFNSSTSARGVWRLASPNPAIESSRFNLDDGGIEPVSFRFEDGSRKGEDNYSLEFDQSNGSITINATAGETSLAYQSGLLDRGSLQVALMYDLGLCRLPGPYRYVDDDGVREYRYQRLEDLNLESEIGALETVRFSQQREGSSRNTVLWLAPELSYLPVRIEQIRDGEVETVLAIEAVTGLERNSPSCSSLR